jgi:hypothetical protein
MPQTDRIEEDKLTKRNITNKPSYKPHARL